MFKMYKLTEQDLKRIELLKKSSIKSRRVVGRRLVSDAAEIRASDWFQENLKLAAKLVEDQHKS